MDNTKLCPYLDKNGTCVAGEDRKVTHKTVRIDF